MFDGQKGAHGAAGMQEPDQVSPGKKVQARKFLVERDGHCTGSQQDPSSARLLLKSQICLAPAARHP